jgi:hypothetical protein
MFDPRTLSAMRDELTKLATQGYGQPPHEYEEMTVPKWKQTAKDLPAAILGGGLGYAIGKTTSEYVMPKVLSTPQGVATAQKWLPGVAAAASGVGTYLLSAQRGMLKQRRLEADRKAREEKLKSAGARVPAAANATYKDPWRTDTRYPNRT